jgi:hypothetical protein
MLDYRNTLTGLSTTGGYPTYFPDLTRNPFLVSVSAAVNSTAVVFSAEHTFDYTGSSVFISSNARWYASTGITAAATTAFTVYTFPVTAIRINSSTGSSIGTIAVTMLQAG